MPASRIAFSSSMYGRRCAAALGGDEEVGAVEPHRVDLASSTKREISIARESSLPLDRLELLVLDDHELALRDLPALHELVRADLAVVLGAPALLLDRRQALAVEQAEGDVRLRARQTSSPGRGPTGIVTSPKLSEPFQVVRMLLDLQVVE